MAIFWSFVIRSQYIFEKKNQVKIPSIFFMKHYNTKARPKPNIFLKIFSNRVASDRKPSMYFFRMLWTKTNFLKLWLNPRKIIIKNRGKKMAPYEIFKSKTLKCLSFDICQHMTERWFKTVYPYSTTQNLDEIQAFSFRG